MKPKSQILKQNFIQKCNSNPCVYAFIPTIQLQSQILYIHPFKIRFHNQKSSNKCAPCYHYTCESLVLKWACIVLIHLIPSINHLNNIAQGIYLNVITVITPCKFNYAFNAFVHAVQVCVWQSYNIFSCIITLCKYYHILPIRILAIISRPRLQVLEFTRNRTFRFHCTLQLNKLTGFKTLDSISKFEHHAIHVSLQLDFFTLSGNLCVLSPNER